MNGCKNRYKVQFLNRTKTGADDSQALIGLQKRARLSDEQFAELQKRSPCTIKSFATSKEAKAYISQLWTLGWHSRAVCNGKVVYTTPGYVEDSVADIRPIVTSIREQESLAFPKAWQPLSGLNERASLQAGNLATQSYFVSIAQEKALFTELPHTELYAKTIVSNAVQILPACFISRFCQLIALGNTSQRVYLSELSSKGQDVAYLIAVLEGQQKFYALYFWCPIEDYSVQKTEFLGILESFQLSYLSGSEAA